VVDGATGDVLVLHDDSSAKTRWASGGSYPVAYGAYRFYDDRAGVIPYDKMEEFFKTNLQ